MQQQQEDSGDAATEEIKELLRCGVSTVQCEAQWRAQGPWRLGWLSLTQEGEFVFLYTSSRRGVERRRTLFVANQKDCAVRWWLF